ncbi:NusA-like transcription termination signal-binding factor [Halalkalicoccus sp. NIPERK01]|uniref:NusA-like transcription termination signal-binding factor n=1 Tax=Halalkalicoccus sp. NIPERK01 TaxID=3053469 RepID=UPI00256F0AD8|nr:NusA-like transcription termination signal-binding factor [Halalkalicoccus sp. NIPERK01]MDL5362001.1 NusA-like transcription termination signal-binding factor [Halalkalicoccus sp. NIPERK01]
MARTLSDDARRYIAAFEDETGATATDCVIDGDRLVFVVGVGEMGRAIGPGGKTVHRLEERLGKDVDLVEDADTPEAFVANALAPAAVYHVTISENDTLVAYAEVAEGDRGVAIGSEGRNIETARTLAKRHFDLDDIQLT